MFSLVSLLVGCEKPQRTYIIIATITGNINKAIIINQSLLNSYQFDEMEL